MNRVIKNILGMLFFLFILAFSSQLVCAQTSDPADAQSKAGRSPGSTFTVLS